MNDYEILNYSYIDIIIYKYYIINKLASYKLFFILIFYLYKFFIEKFDL